MISEYWMQVLALTAINAIVGMGLYLCVLTRQLNLAQAALMGIGSYAAAVITRNFELPFAVALVAGGLAGGIVASLLALVIARLRVWIFAVATLGFGQVMVNVFLNVPYLGGAQGFHAVPNLTSPWIAFLALAILALLFTRCQGSRVYYAFLATGDDELTTGAVGINATMIRFMAFTLSGVIAGIGGGLQIHLLGGIEPDSLGFFPSFTFLIFVIVGGERSFWGAILGAAILTILPELLRFSAYERYILYGLILLLVMIFWPSGLLRRTRIRVRSRASRALNIEEVR